MVIPPYRKKISNKKVGDGWDILNHRMATVDKIPFDVTQLSKMAMLKKKTGKVAALVKCPVCLFPTGILINTAHKTQQRNCNQCNSVHMIKLLPTGRYKIKNALGIMDVADGEITYRDAVNPRIKFE
jgi:hypothetical protein